MLTSNKKQQRAEVWLESGTKHTNREKTKIRKTPNRAGEMASPSSSKIKLYFIKMLRQQNILTATLQPGNAVVLFVIACDSLPNNKASTIW